MVIISIEKARCALKSFMIIVYENLEVTKWMGLPEFIDKCYNEKLESIVKAENEACKAVLKLMESDYPDPIKDFFADTGKRYAMTNNNEECQRFLIDYFKWLSYEAGEKLTADEIVTEKAGEVKTTVTETIKETITIVKELPGKVIPGDGGLFGIGNKVLLGVVGVIVALVVILIILVKVK